MGWLTSGTSGSAVTASTQAGWAKRSSLSSWASKCGTYWRRWPGPGSSSTPRRQCQRRVPVTSSLCHGVEMWIGATAAGSACSKGAGCDNANPHAGPQVRKGESGAMTSLAPLHNISGSVCCRLSGCHFWTP
ncbi:unnamed protein product [Ixodes persulcatus]